MKKININKELLKTIGTYAIIYTIGGSISYALYNSDTVEVYEEHDGFQVYDEDDNCYTYYDACNYFILEKRRDIYKSIIPPNGYKIVSVHTNNFMIDYYEVMYTNEVPVMIPKDSKDDIFGKPVGLKEISGNPKKL